MKIQPATAESDARFLKKHGLEPLPQEELDRREQAALRLKEQLSSKPFYKNKTMTFWRNLQSSQALAD